MKVKYNRVSTLQQSGERFNADKEKYDLILLDKVSGSVSFNDRTEGKKLRSLIRNGKVKEVVVEELSRLGRNTGDVIRTLEQFEELEVNVVIRNLGIQSRPQGKKNPIWKMMSSVLSSMYEMELENIKERTSVGRNVFVQKGGKLGRPSGSGESEKKFLEKLLSKKIIGKIQEGRSVLEISKYLDCSTTTVVKVRKIGKKYGLFF
jgi:DNA invertase Pin-like site-specific DNA recombinase